MSIADSIPTIYVDTETTTELKVVDAAGTVGIDCDYNDIDDAIDDAQAGWRVVIKAGSYTMGNFHDLNGSVEKPIVFVAYGNGEVLITTGGDVSCFILRSTHLIIDGGINKYITFDGTLLTTGQHILYVYGTSSYITIRRCTFQNGAGGDYTASYVNNCINCLNKSSYFKFYNNIVTTARGMGIYNRNGDQVEIRNNYINYMGGGGIQSNPHSAGEYTDEVWITGNYIDHVGQNYDRGGISVLGATEVTWIYNNIVIYSPTGIKNEGGAGSGKFVYNNTCLANTTYDFYLKDSTSAMLVKNNLGASSNIGTGLIESNNKWDATETDFQSIVVTSNNFLKLDADSDAVDGGATLSDVMIDFWGTPRPQDAAYDIGANEYLGSPLEEDPEITITIPTTDPDFRTSALTITVGGTSSDSDGTVESVTWVNSLGGSGTASGTTSWSITNMALFDGYNIVTVTATDNDLNTDIDVITIAKNADVLTMSDSSQEQTTDTIVIQPFGWLFMQDSSQRNVADAVILSGIPGVVNVANSEQLGEADNINLSATDNVAQSLLMQNSSQLQQISAVNLITAQGKMRVVVNITS